MRTDVIRWTGLCAVLFALAFVASQVVAAGVDVYADETAEVMAMLGDINNHEAAFAAGGVLGLVAAVFLIPIPIGLFYIFQETDRPYSVIAGVFLEFGALFLVISSLFQIALIDAAADYSGAATAAEDALLHDAQSIHNLMQLFFFGPPVGIALLVTGVLTLRSGSFHKAIGIIAILGGLGGLSVFGWFVFLPALLIWSLAVGFTVLIKTRRGAQVLLATA